MSDEECITIVDSLLTAAMPRFSASYSLDSSKRATEGENHQQEDKQENKGMDTDVNKKNTENEWNRENELGRVNRQSVRAKKMTLRSPSRSMM